MSIQGAGGTNGGIGSFFIGLIMMTGGGYLFLESIKVINHFSMNYQIFNVGGLGISSGMVLIPTIFGIGIVFYNAKNILGWLLLISGISMLFFGIISGIDFKMKQMSAFELLSILVLFIGGLGLFLKSLKTYDNT